MIYFISQSSYLLSTLLTGPALMQLSQNPALPWMIATGFLVLAVLILLIRLASMYKAREDFFSHIATAEEISHSDALTQIYESLLTAGLSLKRDPAQHIQFKEAFLALEPELQLEFARLFPYLARYLAELAPRLHHAVPLSLHLHPSSSGDVLEVQIPEGAAEAGQTVSAAEQLALDELHEAVREKSEHLKDSYYEELAEGTRHYCLKIHS